MNLGSINVRIGVDRSGLTQGLDQARSQVHSFAATTGSLTQGMNALGGSSVRTGYAIRSGVGAALSGLGVSGGGAAQGLGLAAQGLTTLGTAGTAAATALGVGLVAALVGLGAAAVRASVSFNEAMANVATLIPGNIERVKELKSTVQDLSMATGRSTDEISGALFDTISAWGDTADAAKKLDIAVRVGIGSNTQAREAVQLLAGVTKAYGDESAKAVQHVADLAFKTDSLGLTTVKQLIPAMTKVAPLASQVGLSVEAMSAVFATAAGTTGNAARVSTQLSGVLQALLNPTETMRALFKAVGVESGEALIKQKGFAGAVQLIVESARASDIPLAKFISRIEGQKLAYDLAGKQAGELNEKMGMMENVTGSLNKAVEEHVHGINELGQKWKEFKATLTVAQQQIGGQASDVLHLAGALDILTTALQAWLKVGKNVSEYMQKQASPEGPHEVTTTLGKWLMNRYKLGEAGVPQMGDKGLRSLIMTDMPGIEKTAGPAVSPVKGIADLKERAATAKALASEQTRYTNELSGAKERLTTLLAGEGNIAGQVAARYHLLTAAQRDNLTAVLKQIEHQTQLNAVQDRIERNSRVRALLSRGESVEVAKLGGQYSQLSTAELRAAFASERVTEAAIQAATSRQAYAKDMNTLNEEIRRLAAGHKAEGGAIEQLAEKYPGLSRALLVSMENARQWKIHLNLVRDAAVEVAQAIRSTHARLLESSTDNRIARAAMTLFGTGGPKLLEQHPEIKSAEQLYRKFLNPVQQGQAQKSAIETALESLNKQITDTRANLATLYGEYTEGPLKGQQGLFDRPSQIAKETLGEDLPPSMSQESVNLVKQKAVALDQLQNSQAQVVAGQAVYNDYQAKLNTLIGASEPQLELLGQQFGALTGKSATAREVMEKFGVSLGSLPKATQQTIRQFLELQRRMDFFREFAQGTQQVFENMFQGLYEHGFKNFFKNVIQGFERMLQQMAARYLASRLTGLVLGLVGSALGAGAAAAGGGGGGAASTGGGGSLGGQIRASFGNLSLSGKAAGGMVQAMTPYMVGEQGRELFVPSSSGTIVPQSQLAGAGGVHVTQHITIQATDAHSIRQNKDAIAADMYRHAQRAFRRNG